MNVDLIDTMGTDLTVVNAARVSFDKKSNWEFNNLYGVENQTGLSEKDQKLISYLAKHNHWTPFSHVMITMRETVPIFIARQRLKHMVGFTYNEISRRYVDDEPEFYVPDAWRKRAENKKQGSSNEIVEFLVYPGDREYGEPDQIFIPIKEEYEYFIQEAERLYHKMIQDGVAPEQARMVLPQSMYTSYYVTGSLAAWARAYKLRSEEHAQKEIQDLSKMWDDIIGNIKELEYSWKALTR